MTIWGWVFLAVSWSLITAINIYCFYKVFTVRKL